MPASVRAIALVAPFAVSLLLGCEPVPQAARASGAVADTTTSSAFAFLIYAHGGVLDTLPEGQTGQAVDSAIDLYLDLGGKVEIESARNHLQVEPARAVIGPVRWSDHLHRLYFRLQGLQPGREITITVREGLAREGLEALTREHVWRLQGVEPTRFELSLDGPGLLRYADSEYRAFRGAVRDSNAVFVIPADSLTLGLRFSRAVSAASVEAVLTAELQEAEIQLSWPTPEHAIAAVVFPPRSYGWAGDMLWSTRYLSLRNLRDERGVPIPSRGTIHLEMEPRSAFWRWDPETGSRPLGEAPPGLLITNHQGTIGPGGILFWHYEEEGGDYYLVSPWLVRPETGAYRRLTEWTTAWSDSCLRWLPDGEHLLACNGSRSAILHREGVEIQLFAGDDTTTVRHVAVHPTDGRLAHLVIRDTIWDELRRVDLVVTDRGGREIDRVVGISRIQRGELWDESLHPAWLPNGRIAFLRRLERSAGVDEGRRLAIVDPHSSAIEETEQTPHRLVDVSPDGVLLFEENELYDVRTRSRAQLGSGDYSYTQLSAFSPDRQWIAGTDYRERQGIGVLRRDDGTWHPVGQGRLVGWSPDGGLYWIGPPPDAPR